MISWSKKIQWRIRRWMRSRYYSVVSGFIERGQPIYLDMPGIWRSYGAQIGSNVHIDATCYIDRGYAGLLEIHDHAVVAMGAGFILHDSSVNNVVGGPLKFGRIIVEAGAYIGAFAIVLPGVTIGKGAIVGAGSLVVSDVPPDTVVVGRPARSLYSVQDLALSFSEQAAIPSKMVTYMPFPSQKEQQGLSPEEVKAWGHQSVRHVEDWLPSVRSPMSE